MKRQRHNQGQALLEFTVMLAMMLSVIMMSFLFIAVFSEYGWRILSLIGLEYP